MKNISCNYAINEIFFSGKIPSEINFLPYPIHTCPVFFEPALISPFECESMVDNMLNAGSDGPSRTSIGARSSTQYPLTAPDQAVYDRAFSHIKPKIEKFYNASLAGAAGAHGLYYEPGDRYGVHCDNCDPVLDPNGTVIRFKHTMPNRQISTLLFLSNSVSDITQPLQHIGGNLSFPFIFDRNDDMLLVEPQIGLFVAFPSNPFFTHEVHEVLEGNRMVIVDWHSARFHHNEAMY